MKTNIRLFVPNTTETLSFEYGLLIHYMTYNDVKARSEISLDYYELSTIDPMSNALDIVEQVTVSEATRSHSRYDGFTLSNHYKLSFDQRYNNKIPEQNVRQVWLWLQCDESIEYPFIVERITDSELPPLSTQNNQLFSRLWAHEDWIDRDINPLAQKTVAGRIGLVTLLTQQLAQQFELIEQENRKKVLAAMQATNPPAPPPVSPPAAVVPVIVAAPVPSTPVSSTPPPPPEPVAAPIAPPPISVRPPAPAAVPVNDREYQPIPPRAPAKSKTWIWVVAAVVLGLPILLLLGQSKQEDTVQAYDPATEETDASATEAVADAPTEAADAVADPAIAASEADVTASSQVLAERPRIMVGMQWNSKTTDYRNASGSYDDVAYQVLSDEDGVVLIDKTITARPDSQTTLIYDRSLNLIGGKTGRYIPALANYDWPLTAGKTWNVTSEVVGNQYKDLQQAAGEVLGRETISTPIGDLEAIKLVVTHTTYLAGTEVSRGQDISWYVPELGRSVRTEETSWDAETQSWVLGRTHEMTSVTLP